jgi:two-component system sensor histidine kinase VicK
MTKGIERVGELSADGVFIYDLQKTKFTYLNDAFATIFSLSREDIFDDPALLLPMVRTEDMAYIKHQFHTLLTTHSDNSTEVRLHKGADAIIHLSCDAFLITDDLIAGFIKDVSKDKEHEDYIMNYGAKKDTLLDMLAHNLTGPLYLSQNLLEGMEKSYTPDAPNEIISPLRILQSTTQECIDIVNDFLHEEHMQSERVYVKKTRFDLVERIVGTLDKLVATNKNKKFILVTELQNLHINTDSVKFFQAIHNLISNSIKFTPPGGEIQIIVEEREHTFVVSVRDNGIGVPVELQEHLFIKDSPSRRLGLRNEKSSGLGLHIVKMLVTLMGGTVGFESSDGNGAVFSIELPKE